MTAKAARNNVTGVTEHALQSTPGGKGKGGAVLDPVGHGRHTESLRRTDDDGGALIVHIALRGCDGRSSSVAFSLTRNQ